MRNRVGYVDELYECCKDTILASVPSPSQSEVHAGSCDSIQKPIAISKRVVCTSHTRPLMASDDGLTLPLWQSRDQDRVRSAGLWVVEIMPQADRLSCWRMTVGGSLREIRFPRGLL